MTTHGVGGSSDGGHRRLGRARSLGVSRPLPPSPFRPGVCHEPFRAPGSPPPTSMQVRLTIIHNALTCKEDKHKTGLPSLKFYFRSSSNNAQIVIPGALGKRRKTVAIQMWNGKSRSLVPHFSSEQTTFDNVSHSRPSFTSDTHTHVLTERLLCSTPSD